MHKQEFLDRLRDGLSGLPQNDIEERLTFYDEMIDDRMEEGLSEEEAITEIGSVDQIISNIIADSPKAEAIKENIKPNRPWKAWEIVLLILGAPLWIPLLIAVASIVFACYIVIWSVAVTLWAVDVSVGATAIGALILGTVITAQGNVLPGIAMYGIALFCAGVSILFYFVCKAATKSILTLTKIISLKITSLFRKKEDTK